MRSAGNSAAAMAPIAHSLTPPPPLCSLCVFSPHGITHVTGMYLSERNPHHVFFTGKGKTSFHTRDMGLTYHPAPQIDIMDVRLHPVHHEWMLASGMSEGCTDSHEGMQGDKCYKIVSTNSEQIACSPSGQSSIRALTPPFSLSARSSLSSSFTFRRTSV